MPGNKLTKEASFSWLGAGDTESARAAYQIAAGSGHRQTQATATQRLTALSQGRTAS